jgi:protein phosphatase
MVVFESAGVTDVGRKRKSNEDSYYVDNDMGLYIVADGMGGHRAGDVASGLVVDSMRDYIKKYKDNESIEEFEEADESLSLEANQLLAGISFSNRIVYHLSNVKESYRGMGSTVAAVYFTDHTIVAANVGDSSIHLVHNGQIELLSVPHTVMAEQKAIDPNAAVQLGDGFKHMLTRAVGVEEAVSADIYEVQFFENDTLILSSDGLTNKVTPEEILEMVNTKSANNACQHLVNLANTRGGDDNITVVIIKVVKTRSFQQNRFFSVASGVIDRLFIVPLRKLFK